MKKQMKELIQFVQKQVKNIKKKKRIVFDIIIKYLGQLSISAIEHVIESLTPNARRIFRLLVEAFLSNSNSKDYEGKNF